MGEVLVKRARVSGGRIQALEVELHGLGTRTIDRSTALRWAKDGHSFLPLTGGRPARALLLIEVGDEHFLRDDPTPETEDQLPELPPC